MPSKRRCPTCGSKQWHKEPSSGIIACSEGHVLQSYRKESKEAEEVGLHRILKRYVKSARQKSDGKSKADLQLYHGAKGRYLYFQCLQSLLKLQVSTLIKLWSLPAEFEVVSRDIWALNLCLLSNPIHGDADEAHVAEGEDEQLAKEPVREERSTSDQGTMHTYERDIDRLLDEDSESLSSGDSEDDSEGGELPAAQISATAQRKGGIKGRRAEEGPASTIAIIVVTCWLLRIPVMYQDFARIIEAYELPYLNFVRLLPTDMTTHLTKHAIQSLSPRHAPTTLTLHMISGRIARKLHSNYGVLTPKMNAAPLLWRAVCCYEGTPTLYTLARRILQVLALPLTLHTSIMPNAPDTSYEKHGLKNAPIEATFAAAIIIVLKLIYGLDGKARVPSAPNDTACSMPLGEDYMEKLRRPKTGEMSKFDSRRKLSVANLDENDIDEYLTFCQQALSGADQADKDLLDAWFPLRQGKADTAEAAVPSNRQQQRVMAMRATSAQPGKNLSPGMGYAIWNGRDMHGELPSDYQNAVRRGARWSGVDEDYVSAAEARDMNVTPRGPLFLSPSSLSHRQPRLLSSAAVHSLLLYLDLLSVIKPDRIPILPPNALRFLIRATTMRRFVKALSFKCDRSENSNPDSHLPSSVATSDNVHLTTKKGRKPSHSLRIRSIASISSSTQVPVISSITSSSTPQLSMSSDHPHSSSASSSAGSVDINPQTPEDEYMGGVPSTIRNKAWSFWVSNKNSFTATSKKLGRPMSKVRPDPPPISHTIIPSEPSIFLHRTYGGEAKAGIYDILDEASTGSENETGPKVFDRPHNVADSPQLYVNPADARQNMLVLIANKSRPVPVSYPLASSYVGPLYPRSCNNSSDLPRERSMRYSLFQKRLLRRLDETPPDAVSFPFVIRSRKPIPNDPLASLPLHVTVWPSKALQVNSFSIGIRRWVTRPCFEDTHCEYLPSEEGIVVQRVTGTSFGVAAIEFSEALDILAYPDYYTSDTPAAKADVPAVTIVPPSSQLNPETAPEPEPPSSTSVMSPSILVRNHVSAVPSPLRNNALSSMEKAVTAVPIADNGSAPHLVRRGVHFAEDEDDAIPLHIVRMKRKREEKAKFLRSEQRRREVDARKALKDEEEERRRRELEKIERDKILQQRKAKEEERKHRAYLEQVAAARQRRESNRHGSLNIVAGGSPSDSLRDVDHSSKSRHKSSSDIPVSRKASSRPGTPPHSSSGSSRPPSVNGQSIPTSGEKNSVRPVSTYSVHSEDGLSGTRQGNFRPPTVRNSTFPLWTNNLLVPPALPSMPVMPPFMLPMDPSLSMDMPLLPPVPPFMMQQYSRRSSRQSSPGHSSPGHSSPGRSSPGRSSPGRSSPGHSSPGHSSPGHANSSSSRVGTSINSSSERGDHSARFANSLPPSPSSRSSGFFNPSTSARPSSNIESRRASMPPQVLKGEHSKTTPSARPTESKSARGRLQATSQQFPSPWTALPTQTGRLPMAMPSTQESQVNNTSHSRKHAFIV
ncbi:hypothetical protein APHAL10511_001919 [Amanita phalloides]|nr:hypothetical protein APHAL10511_001919 [Amanita phalloides]